MKKIIIVFSLLVFALPVQAAFDKDLYYGIQGDNDVIALQEFLTDEGLYSGPITGNFYSLTLKAVKAFQAREAITPVAGYFGPMTRSKANVLLSAQTDASNQQAVSETGAIPTPAPVPKTTNDVVSKLQEQITALLQQVALLQQQASLQSAIQQKLDQQTQVIQQQQDTITQIQQNTQQIAQNTTPAPIPISTITFQSVQNNDRNYEFDILNNGPNSVLINNITLVKATDETEKYTGTFKFSEKNGGSTTYPPYPNRGLASNEAVTLRVSAPFYDYKGIRYEVDSISEQITKTNVIFQDFNFPYLNTPAPSPMPSLSLSGQSYAGGLAELSQSHSLSADLNFSLSDTATITVKKLKFSFIIRSSGKEFTLDNPKIIIGNQSFDLTFVKSTVPDWFLNGFMYDFISVPLSLELVAPSQKVNMKITGIYADNLSEVTFRVGSRDIETDKPLAPRGDGNIFISWYR